jgi:hypothetical protein
MLWHMENALRPSIDDLIHHVDTNPADNEEKWVERALELSVRLSILMIRAKQCELPNRVIRGIITWLLHPSVSLDMR